MPIRKIDSVNEWATITYDEANVDLGGGMGNSYPTGRGIKK